MIKQRFGICLAIALALISTQASAIIGLQSAHDSEVAPQAADLAAISAALADALQRGDYETAINILRPFAQAGDPKAQVAMGRFYGIGLGVARDDDAAIVWYRLAAEKGDPDGMNSLGFKLDHAEGPAQNLQEASQWYQRASDAGNLSGTNNLALLYWTGRGVAKDIAETRLLLELAASKG